MKPASEQSQLAKLAVAIHSALTTPARTSPLCQLPDWTWEQCQRDLRKLRHAQQRQWHQAEASLRRDLRMNLERLREEVQLLLDQLRPEVTASPLSAHEIFRDLQALHEEFDDVEWNNRQNTLAVTTGPITLERRYLGPFRLELDTRQLQPQPRYSVVALDPQPAAQDSGVSHPHVQGDQLCEGEGTMPIRAALRDGRMLDFFLIVNNLLQTYNRESPYVSLDAWDGVCCNECDDHMSEDDVRSCELCEVNLCGDCVRSCKECSNYTCYECNNPCCHCDEDVCRRCAQTCCDCGDTFCSSCLHDDERCPVCHEHFQEAAETQSATDLQPVCVGETTVLT